MRKSLKITLTALVGLTLINAGCKKSDITAIDNQTATKISESEIAQRLVTQIAGSLSAQLNNNKLGTSSKNGLTVMGGDRCGDITITPTDKTYMHGDTAITEKGTSVFKLVCSENDGQLPGGFAGYILDDTLHRTESGKHFLNTFQNTMNYKVADQGGIAFLLTGSSYAYARFGTVKKDDVTEYHDFSTKYNMQIQGPVATKNSPAVFAAGQIIFECTQEDFYKEESKRNASYKYSGYMLLSRDVITSYFHHGVNEMVKYEIDVKTGKIISGPTVVK